MKVPSSSVGGQSSSSSDSMSDSASAPVSPMSSSVEERPSANLALHGSGWLGMARDGSGRLGILGTARDRSGSEGVVCQTLIMISNYSNGRVRCNSARFRSDDPAPVERTEKWVCVSAAGGARRAVGWVGVSAEGENLRIATSKARPRTQLVSSHEAFDFPHDFPI